MLFMHKMMKLGRFSERRRDYAVRAAMEWVEKALIQEVVEGDHIDESLAGNMYICLCGWQVVYIDNHINNS